MLRLLSFGLILIAGLPLHAGEYRVGLASCDITPQEPIWMAGYAGRKKPAEGKLQPLWIKALAIEDAAKNRVVMLTSDLCGIPRSLAEPVCERVQKETGLKREAIMLTCSHTHSGPVVRDNLLDMYDMPEVQKVKVKEYGRWLEDRIVETIAKAVKDLQPGELDFSKGEAKFAVNRREVKPAGIALGVNPTGPVDHSVPVLRVRNAKGELRAVVFGYACHNTTLDGLQWSGDYAGFAQEELEKNHPGALAMFWIGCGADANPNPRRTVELARKHGDELASAVDAVLAGKLAPLTGAITASYREIDLPFDHVPDRDELAKDSQSKNFALATRANRFLKDLTAGKAIPTSYPHYPIQSWSFGKSLDWVGLGGEVVVDYDLRLNENRRTPLWIAGYTNDVMAYIPSERVLREGGYEADFSMIYYGQPSKWKAGLEDKIVAATRSILGNP